MALECHRSVDCGWGVRNGKLPLRHLSSNISMAVFRLPLGLGRSSHPLLLGIPGNTWEIRTTISLSVNMSPFQIDMFSVNLQSYS